MLAPRDDARPACKDSTEVARHYGNMRFAMFTVFSAVTGGLLAFPFSAAGSAFLWAPGSARHQFLLGAAGLVLAVLFTAAEWRISQLVAFYQEAAFNKHDFPRPGGHRIWKGVIMVTMLAPYILSAIFWLLYLHGSLVIPVSRS
ncbi:hypothetical protein HQN59_18595 [Schlegelella sp. ID0723]|uniref:Uncharacterized protein n=1 Tax=Piscinibacter koreensis TaxID=2742824 RepID=A0A7Y6TY62_9BURK|nr:hypothetical protein [Schlegelella koreensis]